MKRIDVVSALIRDQSGKILIVKNVKGDSYYWSLPGGSVEAGETLEEAVIREVKEETGFNITTTGLSSIREILFQERGNHALIVTFFASINGGQININDPDGEVAEVIWADKQTAKKLMPSWYDQLKLDSDDSKTLAFYAFEGVQ